MVCECVCVCVSEWCVCVWCVCVCGVCVVCVCVCEWFVVCVYVVCVCVCCVCICGECRGPCVVVFRVLYVFLQTMIKKIIENRNQKRLKIHKKNKKMGQDGVPERLGAPLEAL